MDSLLDQAVELQWYKQDFLEQLKNFDLPEEKVQYTALPMELLDELVDGQYSIVILNENEPVGFFLLHSTNRVKEYSDNPHALLLTALSINNLHQGKGFATKGMNLLKSFVNQELPQYDEIVLAVNHKNIPAKNFMKKLVTVTHVKEKLVS